VRIAGSLGSSLDPQRRDEKSDARQRPAETLPVAVRPAPESDRRIAPSAKPAATVVAQLVAGIEDVPEMRARRRAEPGLGASRYRTMAGLGPAAVKRKLKTI
jgi:hypothetical protein